MDEVKIDAMRRGGKILGNLLRDLKQHVRPGMTGVEVDAWVRNEIVKRGAGVAYDMLDDKFPGAICISVNDELVHGVPKDEPFEIGDKVSFDLDIFYKGYFTDSAFTMIVGGEKTASSAVRQQLSVPGPSSPLRQVAAAEYAHGLLRCEHEGPLRQVLRRPVDRTEPHAV